MNTDEIMGKLREIMRASSQAKVDWSAVGADTAIADLGFDSLAILDLIYDIQQGFGVDFDAEEMTHVGTVGALAEFLKTRMA